VPQVDVVGVCDTNRSAAEDLGKSAAVPAFDCVDELLERVRPSVVHVLTPPRTHAELAVRLLESGINVLVEKPFALSRAEAERMASTARRTGCWVTADHNRRFDPVVQRAAALVERGKLGELLGVEAFQGAELGDGAGTGSHWSGQLPGGVLHNLAPHPLYLVRRFAGRLTDLRVAGRCDTRGWLEEVRLVARGERAIVQMGMSLRSKPISNHLRLLGTEATVEVNLNNMTLVEHRPRQLPKLLGKVWPNMSHALQLAKETTRNAAAFAAGRQRFYPGIGEHLRVLYAAVAKGDPPPVSPQEACDIVEWYGEILRQSAAARSETPEAMIG
jgi:predicted dehydrogenase